MSDAAEKESDESPSFNITLPKEAIAMIEQGLRPFGLYGKKRAQICRALILDALKRPEVQAQIEKGLAKVPPPPEKQG